jgi:hypothetical protein
MAQLTHALRTTGDHAVAPALLGPISAPGARAYGCVELAGRNGDVHATSRGEKPL